MAERAKSTVPDIFADIFVMALSDYSFGSGFLIEEVNLLFRRIQAQPSSEVLYKMLSLLWSIQRFLGPNEIREKTEAVLEAMDRVPNLSPRDESIAILLLNLMEKKDKEITKMIQKRLGKLGKKYPRLFGEVLPPRPRGTRRRKRR